MGVMRWNRGILFLLAVVLAAAFFGPMACKSPSKGPEAYKTDRITVSPRFTEVRPACVMILPVEGVDAMDGKSRTVLRRRVYDLLLEKGYAPLSLSFTDRTLRDVGRFHTPLNRGGAWNTEPFKGVFSVYCDALVFIEMERYQETGQADRFGMDMWGTVGLFDARTMEKLFEHYTRRSPHPTDPGGGRERIVRKAVEEFADLCLAPLPPHRSGAETGSPGGTGPEGTR